MKHRFKQFSPGLLTLALLFGLLLIPFAATVALAETGDTQAANPATLPMIDDFESGTVASWFSYGDWGNGAALDKSELLTTTLSNVGTLSNTVLNVSYNAAGWGAGLGVDMSPYADWSLYDGVSFWFNGTSSGNDFKIIITDDDGERIATSFSDNFTGWKELRFPWANFSRDDGYQPGGEPNDGVTLTAVQAIAFAPAVGSSGTFQMDNLKLYNNTGAVVDDFQSSTVAAWFTYGDWGNGAALDKSELLTTTLSNVGTLSNTVLNVSYNAAGWGAGLGKDISPYADWSLYDGMSFWFNGTNSGNDFKIILTDDDGERISTSFSDNFTGWKELRFPWAHFSRDDGYQPGGEPNDGVSLTAVQAVAFAPAVGSSGTFQMDRLTLFQTTGAVVDDFQSSTVAAWFSYGDYGNGAVVDKSELLTTTLSNVGTLSNTVLNVSYNAAGWGAGLGKDISPYADWSLYDGLSFWFNGTNSGNDFKIILTDNDGERISTSFSDDFTGWQQLSFPWTHFSRDDGYQPGGEPNDGVTLTAVQAVAFAPAVGNVGGFQMDRLSLYSDQAEIEVQAQFNQHIYTVVEGKVATVTVKLSTEASEAVTLTYAITEGTATLGDDYLPQNQGTFNPGFDGGQLVFPVGSTTQAFTIQTIDDTEKEPALETVHLALSNPQGMALGNRVTATLYIEDNESLCSGRTMLIDTFENYSMTLPMGITDTYGNDIGFLAWSDGSPIAITTTQIISPDAMARPGQMQSNTVVKFDSNIGGWGGFTHNFEDDTGDTWETQDWSTYEGFAFWLYGTGNGHDIGIELQENRPLGATVPDDGGTEVWNYTFKDDATGWRFVEIPWGKFTRKEIGNGAPNDGLTLENVHGWAFISLASGGAQTHYFDNVQVCGERVVEKELQLNFTTDEYPVTEGQTATMTVMMNMTQTEAVSITYHIQESGAVPGVDYTPVSGTLTFAPDQTEQSFQVSTIDNSKTDYARRVVFVLTNPSTGTLGYQQRGILVIEDDDPFTPGGLDDFQAGVSPFQAGNGITVTVSEILAGGENALPGQLSPENVISVTYQTADNVLDFATGMLRRFGGSQNWQAYEFFKFWFFGQNSGKDIQVEILDNRLPDPGPSGWQLVWSDEFSEAAGTPPNPQFWTHEIGDGAVNGITGWGNGEFQYYTDSTDNAATDGNGNLVISARKIPTDTQDLICWYGPCEYTSARLISKNKIDFAYGRIEARVKVPAGQGLWPAFWMLGSDIDQVEWPMCGEIDIVEYVGKDPNAVYGTLHGPGYSGGQAYGSGPFDLGEPVANDFHTFAVEWEPGVVRWYIDDTNFFTGTETYLTENFPSAEKWVYDHPHFLLLNLAVGGNFPGNPDETTPFPAQMVVDYVRVYQAPDTAERFNATFTDDFTGWQEVVIPFSAFTRTATTRAGMVQPPNAPNDGLTLSEMWGYAFNMPANSSGMFYLDQIGVQEFEKLYLPLIMK